MRYAGWRSHGEWAAAAAAVIAQETALTIAAREAGPPTQCGVCGPATRFVHPAGASDREGHLCARCGCNARQRAVAMELLDVLRGVADAKVHVTEQASPFYVALRRRVPGMRGSEFGAGWWRRLRLGVWLARHGCFERIRLRDLRALGFSAASLDALVTQDVLEHVADHRAALREAARVLRPGGTLLVTVPFYDASPRSEQIAWPDGRGGARFAGAPEFHGDPVAGGVPCYHHFGWDLLDDLREAGFADARARRVHDPQSGLPEAQWVLRARR